MYSYMNVANDIDDKPYYLEKNKFLRNYLKVIHRNKKKITIGALW